MIKIYSFVFFLAVLPAIALGYSTGPPDGRTGAPGEETCWNLCHSSFPLNSGDGSLTITGPDFFQAGQTYTIVVEIADPGQSRWGFEFTPLNFGSIQITDPTNTQLSSSGENSYVKHTSLGTHAGTPNGPVSWNFDWTAPADPPFSVTFYAAGNAANNNGANTGDYIYTTSFTSDVMSSGVDDDPFTSLPSHLSINNYPNPFNSQTTISFNLPVSGRISIEIYNLNGQLIEAVLDETRSAGEHSVVWNAGDLPSGLYFYRLTAENSTSTKKMTLLK
jgi:hypothetical protein